MESIRINPLVCVFDSGIGGLNLLIECVRRLPRVDFAYFADNYRVPYGALTQGDLLKLAEEKFDSIAELNPVAAVVACNTVTANCIEDLRKKYPFHIIGIQPAIKPAAAHAETCLVLATPSTANSESFKKLMKNYDHGHTRIVSCSDLAAFIEKNIGNLSPQTVKPYLPEIETESVVLGCTHYIYIENIIREIYNCPIYDGIEGTVDHLCEILGNFDHQSSRSQKITFSGGNEQKNRSIFHSLLKGQGKFLPKN